MDTPDLPPTRRNRDEGRWRLILTGASVFLVVVAVGILTSPPRTPPPVVGLPDSGSGTGPSPGGGTTHAASDDRTRSGLESYVRTLTPSSTPRASSTPTLPDVDTLIGKLAERLRSNPQDVKGWSMLGWSYFHTERYAEAVAAYATALKLDPTSSDLRTAYEQAKSRAGAGAAAKVAE
jgi:hypothetical protein